MGPPKGDLRTESEQVAGIDDIGIGLSHVL